MIILKRIWNWSKDYTPITNLVQLQICVLLISANYHYSFTVIVVQRGKN